MKRFVQRLAVACGAIAVGLLLVELGLRWTGFSDPSFYVADDVRGWALRPGSSGTYTREGRAFVRINAHGMRERELPREKPAGTFRIAILGDSYVEARQVPLEQTLGAVLERELAGCTALAGRRVESLNFGVSGYSTTQELLTLEHHGWAFEPDLVILALLPTNDLRDNLRELASSTDRPFHVLRGGTLEIDRSFLDSPAYRRRAGRAWRIGTRILGVSRVLQLANYVRTTRTARREARLSAALAGEHGLGEAGLETFVFGPPSEPVFAAAWAVTEAVLRELRDAVAQRGARLHLALVSSPSQVDPDDGRRRATHAGLGGGDPFYAERRLAEFGRREGIEVSALPPRLLERARLRGEIYHGFEPGGPPSGHWNALGHRAAAELLAEDVCRALSGSGAVAAVPAPD